MRLLVLILTTLFILSGIAYADPGEKIAILVIPEKTFVQDADMMASIQKAVAVKFAPTRYDIKIVDKDFSPALSEFNERYAKDGSLVTKANVIQYAQDIEVAKIVVIKIYPVNVVNWFNGAGSTWIRADVELDTKAFQTSENRYILDQSIITKEKGRVNEGLDYVLQLFNAWQVPPALK